MEFNMEELKRRKRELVKKGHIIEYYEDLLELPDGKEVIYDFINHNGAAAIVPVDSDGMIILVRQYRNAINRFTLEIPAGGLNPGEDRKTAAARELEEETGYRSEHVMHLLDLYTTVAFCNEMIGIYYTEELIPSKQHLDEDEYVDVERHSLEELTDMIYRGEIMDAKTIAAILAYKNLKNQ